MISRTLHVVLLVAVAAFCKESFAQLSVRDDLGRTILVKEQPKRIVSLAPFLTEMVYALGAGHLLVGVDALSDYPPQAASLPRVGTGAQLSIDQLAPLKPDLVLAWRDGIRKDDVERIAAFGSLVYVAQARHLDDVPRLLEAIGRLTGRDPLPVMADFESRLDRLKRDYSGKFRLAAFIEIWNRPLTTVSGNHFLNEALDICRADNVFEDLPGFAPKVTWEALQTKNPYVIIGAGSASNKAEFRANWALRSGLMAVKAERLVYVDHESIQRPSPRSPEGIAQLCEELDKVRAGWTASADPEPAAETARVLPDMVPRVPAPAAARPVAAPTTPAAVATPKPATPAKPRRPSQYGM
jgi:iron complex transport system substrate-binding protein